MKARTADAVVIGAGPAGLAAANQIAQGGLSVLLVDENERVGGQITRQAFIGPTTHLDRLAEGVTFLPKTQCLGFLDPQTIALSEEGLGSTVRTQATVVATGGIERAFPVPGWTTPGVMTVGAAQTFLKGSGASPYQRVVLAGTGPLLLAAASQLLRAGVTVAAIVESSKPGFGDTRSALRALSGGSILLEGAGYIADILKHRVPVYLGYAVNEVERDQGVSGVRLQPLSGTRQSKKRFIRCDAVLMSHGFNSASDLASQAGAELVWNELMQTFTPERNDTFETTVPLVWAAGDCAGIGGSKIAGLEGKLAGHAVAEALGGSGTGGLTARDVAAIRRKLRALDRFRRGMDEMFSVDPSILKFATPDTIACRCQQVTVREIQDATLTGAPSVHGAKLWTRAGMGPCQGRSCGHIIDRLVSPSAESGAPTAHSRSRSRFPIRPASAKLLAEIFEQVSD